MASSLRTKLRIAASVLFATGFWDAVAGRLLFQSGAQAETPLPEDGPSPEWRDLAGALHVHSTYSDGAGDIPTVMNAACAAGVDWVLLADHNTQRPLRDGWERRYEEKPLLLIGTEVTVEHGAFLLALDMPPEWEPTKDQKPQTAIDEVNARGGIPLVSLPFDVKHPWRDWDADGYLGLEVLNLSTVARRHINLVSLLWLLPLYKARGTMAALRALVTRPDQAIARWDSLTAGGRQTQVGIGALDAHALMKIGKNKYPIPSYEDSFRAATTHALIPADASDGRAALYDALRAGRCYFAYDCLGAPDGFSFHAAAADACRVEMGGRIVMHAPDGTVTLTAQARPDTLLRLYRDGKVVAAGRDGRLVYAATEPGAYRVEAYQYAVRFGPLYLGTRPWVFSNPIYVSV
jgi:hypothetical protein